MHRVLAATLALCLATPTVAVAQSFQFMTLGAREQTSLLPFPANYRGYVAGGDLDGDGDGDLVTTLSGGAGVFLRAATGWLTPTITSLGGQSDVKPVLVDLDADGDRDVLFVSPHVTLQRLLYALENTPAGMMQVALPPWLATTLFRGTAFGDLDADGLPDLVLSTHEGHVLPFMVARGRPGMQFAQDLTAIPSGLQAGLWPVLLDVDGDGDLDVLATSANSSLRLLRNAGGSFTNASSSLPPTRAGQTSLMAADLDGDGRTDCAATLLNGDLDVLWGGAGGFTVAQAVASVPGLRWLSADDFDGDQDLDLLADHGSGLDVLWNLGNRQFTRGNVLSQRTALRGSADIDGNGRADVVFTTEDADMLVRCKYEARIEDAAYAVGQQPLVDIATMPQSPQMAGDVDGDGRIDLVTPGQAWLTVDHALGGGAYRRTTSAGTAGSGLAWRSELADMDGDGDLDVVVKDSARVRVARNDGSGSFTWPTPSSSASNGGFIDDLRVADVDGDGDRDLVLVDQLGVVLVRNLGGGQFAPAVVLVPSAIPAACVEVADVDGDGDLDVITDRASGVGQEHVILANDGTGNFAPGAAFRVALGRSPFSVRAGDLDGDGDADLVVANLNDSTLRVHRNDGSGRFTDTTLADLPPVVFMPFTNVVLADFDGDGDLDAGAMTFGAAPCLLLFNDGNGHFTDRSSTRGQLLGLAIQARVLRAADLDGDGDVDLCAAGGGFQFVLTNHLRQCRSAAAPRLGGAAEFLLFSGPGFGQPGLGMLGLAFAPATSPLHLPGVAGALDLDLATLQIVSAVTTSSIGVSSAFVGVPQDPVLFGLGFWAQGGILPATGAPGLTNAVYEVVLR